MFTLLIALGAAEPIVKFAGQFTNCLLTSNGQTLEAHSFDFYGNGLVVRAQVEELMLGDGETLVHFERKVRVTSLFRKGKSMPLDIQFVIDGPLSVSDPGIIRDLMFLVNTNEDLKSKVSKLCWINPLKLTSRGALESSDVISDRSNIAQFLRPFTDEYVARPPILRTRAVPFEERNYSGQVRGFDYVLDSGEKIGRLRPDPFGRYDLKMNCGFWRFSVDLTLFFYKSEAITEADQPDVNTICSQLSLVSDPELFNTNTDQCSFRNFNSSRWAFAEDSTPKLLKFTCLTSGGTSRVFDNVFLPRAIVDGIRYDIESFKSEYAKYGLPLRTIYGKPLNWRCLAFLRSSFFSSDYCQIINQSKAATLSS